MEQTGDPAGSSVTGDFYFATLFPSFRDNYFNITNIYLYTNDAVTTFFVYTQTDRFKHFHIPGAAAFRINLFIVENNVIEPEMKVSGLTKPIELGQPNLSDAEAGRLNAQFTTSTNGSSKTFNALLMGRVFNKPLINI